MFEKKEKKDEMNEPDQVVAPLDIESIPESFYGGRNPTVYQQGNIPVDGEKRMGSAVSIESMRREPKLPRDPSGSGFFSSRGFKITALVLFLIIAIGGITVFYLSRAGILSFGKSPEEPFVPEAPTIEIPVEQPEDIEIESAEASTTTTNIGPEEPGGIPTTTPSLQEQPIEFPSTILINSTDLDIDGLTDLEEELFGTDTGIGDTDNDGFKDGLEVVNLYNPRGIAPMRIIDSGIVQEYVNPTYQYRLYHPVGWEVAAVDPQAKQVIFSSVTGDYIEVRVMEKGSSETFLSWFGRFALGQQFTDLEQFENRFQEDGYKRKDSLVAYYINDDIIYVMVYHVGTTGRIPYRQSMHMMVQSFRPSRTFVQIPDQNILPDEDALRTTTTLETITEIESTTNILVSTTTVATTTAL
ncbi:MAG: hypothetical protein ABII02_04315 [Candidatus Magasanikbacteria bacterium]